MKQFITSSLIASFALVQPAHASAILPAIEHAENPAQLMEQILCPSGIFNADKARQVLFQLKREVKKQHGIDIDLHSVTSDVLRIMASEGKFSEAEIQTAHDFYSQLLEPEVRVCNKGKIKKNKSTEFVLPDKMAIGFVCIFSGALLCILPFGITQAIDTGLIGSGIYSVMDGAREGEKPYYIDSDTRERIAPNNPLPDSSIGVGTKF